MSDSYLPDNGPRDILLSLEELAAKKLPHAPTFRKAADEITRLRAENEKLREALKPLAAITLWTDKYPDGPLSVGDNQRYIDPQWIVHARAAIEGVKEPASPWRDIESAPKDGTPIVVGIYFDGGKYPEEGRWDFWVDSWRKYASGYGEGFGEPYRPTHWMPLPEPPSGSQRR